MLVMLLLVVVIVIVIVAVDKKFIKTLEVCRRSKIDTPKNQQKVGSSFEALDSYDNRRHIHNTNNI